MLVPDPKELANAMSLLMKWILTYLSPADGALSCREALPLGERKPIFLPTGVQPPLEMQVTRLAVPWMVKEVEGQNWLVGGVINRLAGAREDVMDMVLVLDERRERLLVMVRVLEFAANVWEEEVPLLDKTVTVVGLEDVLGKLICRLYEVLLVRP